MSRLEFGIGLLGYHGCWDDAAFAEEHGIATVAMFDTQLLGGETFAHLALIADRTKKARVGTLVAVVSNRASYVTAQGIATINKIAPGRVFLGLGAGYTARNTMGLPPAPVNQVRQHVEDCRALLNGGEIQVRTAKREGWARFMQREGWSINIEDKIPIYTASDGPKGLAATGELADGWVAAVAYGELMGASGPQSFGDSLGVIKQAAAGAGRSFDDRYTMISNNICITEPGESLMSPRVLERVGALAMLPFQTIADNPETLEYYPSYVQERWPIFEREVLSKITRPSDRRYHDYHRGHMWFLRDGEEKVLTEEIIRARTLTGTADEIIEQLCAYESAGLRNITMYARPEYLRETVLEVEEKILPAFAD
jgi:alkanesulfonate monooxygenase SsuD/methylene tetrahydromethanopterin reductase-like flavin-dependent oxidoreductase (luciferase family)